MVHQMAAAPEALAALTGTGDITILPMQSREGRAAKRMILTARKGARGPFQIAPPMVLHDGLRHERDGDGYSAAADLILRQGEALRL